MLRRPGHAVQIRWQPVLVLIATAVICYVIFSDFMIGPHHQTRAREGPIALQPTVLESMAASNQNKKKVSFQKDNGMGKSSFQESPSPLDEKETERKQAEVLQLIGKVEDETFSLKHAVASLQQQLDEKKQERYRLLDETEQLAAKVREEQAVLDKKLLRVRQLAGDRILDELGNTEVNPVRIEKPVHSAIKFKHEVSKFTNDPEEHSHLSPDERKRLEEESMRQNAFNEFRSRELSLHRDIPDSRDLSCRHVDHRRDLPEASVIICFVNEVRSSASAVFNS